MIWSKCFSNEDAKAKGFKDRDALAKQDCINKGYSGVTGKWKNCGNWKFALECSKNPPATSKKNVNYGPEWTKCYSDEDAKKMGLKNRDSAGRKECNDKGYLNFDKYNDCGDWKFQFRCKDKKPVDHAPCFSDEDARKQKLANRNKLADKWCISNGYAGSDSKVYKDCGDWRFSVKCTKPTWLDKNWKDEGCDNEGLLIKSRQINAFGLDWDLALDYMLKQIGSTIDNMKVIKKEKIKGTGAWIKVRLENKTCKDKISLKWDPETWKKDTCKNQKIKRSSRLMNIKGDWKKACESTKVTIDGKLYNKPDRCVNLGAGGMWGEIDQDCSKNAGIDRNKFKDYKCFNEPKGPHGEYRNEIMNTLKLGDQFTLRALNWIGGKDKYTFLQCQGGDAFQTIDNVVPSSTILDKSFIFTFTKEGCFEKNMQLLYGDRVQLKSVNTNKFIQCGAGTCSQVKESGNCEDGKWQSFTIESVDGKSGPICYGDKIRISQVVGDKADITPAGGKGMWATAHGSNQNSVLVILPVGGSIYKDPSKEMEEYNKTAISELCKKDPLNTQCTGSALLSFFKKIKVPAIIAGVIALLILIIAIIIKLKYFI